MSKKKTVVLKVVQYYRMESNISTKGKTEFQNRIHLPQCQSTNDELLQMLRSSHPDLPEGFVVSTSHQTAGRGLRGAVWESNPDENLLFSLFLKPDFLSFRHSFWLSATIATAVSEVLQPFIPNVKVKWPNDILCGDLKLGGILIENTGSGTQMERSVVGIGLNVHQLDVPDGACSLVGMANRRFDMDDLLQRLLESIFAGYRLLKVQGWEKTRSRYYRNLYRFGTVQTYELPDGTLFKAILKSIQEDGHLVLSCWDGDKRFAFKEVAFVRSEGKD